MLELNKVCCGDCLQAMKDIDDNSIDLIATDPPYGLKFMAKNWDKAVPSVETWKECLRVLKPGAFAFIMCIPRQDCLARMVGGLEEAGFNTAFTSLYWAYACLSADTEVLTQEGWKDWEQLNKPKKDLTNLNKCSIILVYDKETNEFRWETPERWQAYNVKDTCFRIKSNKTDQFVSRNHRVYIEREGRILWEFAERLQETEKLPVLGDLFDLQRDNFSSCQAYRIFTDMLKKMPVSNVEEKERKAVGTKGEKGEPGMSMLWEEVSKERKRATKNRAEKHGNVLFDKLSPKSKYLQILIGKWKTYTSDVGRTQAETTRANEGREKLGLERWGDLLRNTQKKKKTRDGIYQEKGERELQQIQNKIYSLSQRVFGYVSQGWLCYGTSNLGGTAIGETSFEGGSSSPQRPQSRKQFPQQPNAFHQQPIPQTSRSGQTYQTTLATIQKEYYEGIVFCPTVSTGCFIARRKGKIFLTGNSGFPKASNIGKMVDKRNGRTVELFQKIGRHIKEKREKANITLKQMNKMFSYVAGCNWWESQNDNNTRLPNLVDWNKLKELIGVDDKYTHIIKREEVKGEIVGRTIRGNAGFSNEQVPRPWKKKIGEDMDITAPATSQAKALDGSFGGFQPKPAVEVILVAMKSLDKDCRTYVDQALKNKHGITWLDDCRIPHSEQLTVEGDGHKLDTQKQGWGFKAVSRGNQGRFPANLLCEDNVLNDGKMTGAGITGSGKVLPHTQGVDTCFVKKGMEITGNFKGDSGSFSRYFNLDAWWQKKLKELPEGVQRTFPFLICPKSSRAEKNRGCENLQGDRPFQERKLAKCKECGCKTLKTGAGKQFACGHKSGIEYEKVKHQPRGNIHPTAKPVKLFSYLITLGSRQGDIVLDPFVGSGTTCVAAKMLGRNYIGIEKEVEYVAIAEARIKAVIRQMELEV